MYHQAARCSNERSTDPPTEPHARSAIAESREDFNTARPHSSLGYQTPATFAETLTATGYDDSLDKGFASAPVAQPAPYGVTETAEALIAAG
ncbi:transposase [Pseudohoeflea sp. DP4N28-3]|uniref:Transposase n=1 Tax=Pseudohoeflea coraliihabitans TaxID=2860393 RepID=A0ABS6WQ17_9HYPH|nr:transposase [Pseudohoeflea sp. DP4N28-3]